MSNNPSQLDFWRRRIAEVTARGRPVQDAVAYWAPEIRAEIQERSRNIIMPYITRGWIIAESRVLDVCCGCGDLIEVIPDGCFYRGIDVVPEFIETAKARYGKREYTEFAVVDIAKEPYNVGWAEPGYFDIAVCRDVEGTVGGSIGKSPAGADLWGRVVECLVRYAHVVLMFSYQHTKPKVVIGFGKFASHIPFTIREAE